MSVTSPGLFRRDTRGGWVRLRTLILLRWLAVAGQAGAITLADRVIGLQIELWLCYAVVGASVLANLVALALFPVNKRLSDVEAMLTLLFDIAQLVFLLYLTGGLTNPFAMLVLVPVTISATALRLRTTVFLGAVSIALVTLLAIFYQPLRLESGESLGVPPIFELGYWLAIVIGVIFLGFYAHRVASEIHAMTQALLATQMALAREQKLTDLGGVVAATAHELGTPLATIKLVSSELSGELADHPELREDAELIRDQADRCRDILQSMGRAGKDDPHLHSAPLETLIREAAEPHTARGKTLHFDIGPRPGAGSVQLQVLRRPEVIHGLRNLVQNAVDFARAEVRITGTWDSDVVVITISDDGPGYAPQVLARIGDPFMRQRGASPGSEKRPEYEGMGLGLFIAKTLLERSGATLDFANAAAGPETGGAVVTLRWDRTRIEAPDTSALGPNTPITV